MSIVDSLSDFQSALLQCDALIEHCHVAASDAAFNFTSRDVEQVTEAAFLNLFKAWEEFVEAAFYDFMLGDTTISGDSPVRFVTPQSKEHATRMMLHTGRYFDFANIENVRKVSMIFFEDGYPFRRIIDSISEELGEMKTVRNACAHKSKLADQNLKSLASKIFGRPIPDISVYRLLIGNDPRAKLETTVYGSYHQKLLLAGQLIAQG